MINVIKKYSTHFYIQENIENTPTSSFYILEGNLKNVETMEKRRQSPKPQSLIICEILNRQ